MYILMSYFFYSCICEDDAMYIILIVSNHESPFQYNKHKITGIHILLCYICNVRD